MSQGNVADLLKKLRKMHGHLSAKDRAIVVEAVGALSDLSLQLWNATHTTKVQAPRGRVERIRVPSDAAEEISAVSVESNPLSVQHVTPRSTAVIVDIEEPDASAAEGHPI